MSFLNNVVGQHFHNSLDVHIGLTHLTHRENESLSFDPVFFLKSLFAFRVHA